MAFPRASNMLTLATSTREKWQEKARLLEKNRIIEGIYDAAKYGNIFYEYYPQMTLAESDLQRDWLDELCFEFEEELEERGYCTEILYTFINNHVESISINWGQKTNN